MNFCRSCKQDFGSVSAFDGHRTGKHAYTYVEGYDLEPRREDGRRCLDSAELEAKGWAVDAHGRWRTPAKVPFSERQAKRVPLVALEASTTTPEASPSSCQAESEAA